MQPSLWNAVLRKDPAVALANRTEVKRMTLNLRMSLGEANWCQVSTFIVTVRKDAADKDPCSQGLILGDDYIFNSEGYNPTLNSAIYKVHFVKHCSLMTSAWETEKAVQGNSELIGNPQTTLRRCQVKMDLNYKIRQPSGGLAWKDMEQLQFAPHMRLYLLMFFKGNTNEVDDNPVRVDWDAHYVTFNAA